MVNVLLPIVSGSIAAAVNRKIEEKLSEWELKDKAKQAIENTYKNTLAYKKIQNLKISLNLKKIQNLEGKLKSEMEKLKRISDTGDLDKISKQLTVVEKIQTEIDTLKADIQEKTDQELERKQEIERKLENLQFSQQETIQIPDAFEGTNIKRTQKKTKANTFAKNIKTVNPIQEDISTQETEGIKITKVGQYKINDKENYQEDTDNIITKGRPAGSKDKQKRKARSLPTENLLEMSKPATLTNTAGYIANTFSNTLQAGLETDNNLALNNQPILSEEAINGTQIDKRLVQTMDLLVINNNEQLIQLEKLNKNIKDVTLGNEKGLKDVAKNLLGGKTIKNVLKYVPGIAAKAAVPAAMLYEGYNQFKDYKQKNQELDAQLQNKQITKQEFAEQKAKLKTIGAGRFAGTAGGALGGAAIGTALLPGIGTVLGGIGGGLLGKWGGEKGSEQLFDYLKTTAYLESGFKADAKASTSSASGMFQFTEGTWKDMNKKYNLNYTPEDRLDPKKSAQMAALLATENKKAIEKGTGKEASNTDLYMGHFLGASGAVNFLNAKERDGNQLAAEDPKLKKAAIANKSIFYKSDGTPRTYNEVYALMDNKYKKGEKIADKVVGDLKDAQNTLLSQDTTMLADNTITADSLDSLNRNNIIRRKSDNIIEPEQMRTTDLARPITNTINKYDKDKEEKQRVIHDMEMRKMEAMGIKAQQPIQINMASSSTGGTVSAVDEISGALLYSINS